jgi:hypothetical protein
MVVLQRSPVTGPVWPRGFQEVWAPKFSWHSALEGGEVVSLTHRPPLPPGMFLVLIFTRGWVDPRAMERSEGKMSLKNPVTPPGIDPGTVRLVAQRLNHYATPGHKRGQVLMQNKRKVLNALKVEHKVREKYSLLGTARFKVSQRHWPRFSSSRTRQSAERRHISEELHIQYKLDCTGNSSICRHFKSTNFFKGKQLSNKTYKWVKCFLFFN